MVFGEAVRVWRRGKSLSLEVLAKEVGLRVPHLSGIERGVREPTAAERKAIVEALGMPAMWLRARGPDPLRRGPGRPAQQWEPPLLDESEREAVRAMGLSDGWEEESE